jgi:RHS repeat-associated protein
MSETFVYDDQNKTVTHTDFNGQLTSTVNDAMSRVSTITYADNKLETFTYWPSGHIKTATVSETGKDDQITSYTYDNRDRLTTETQPNGTVLSYDYDANGNRTQVTTTRTTTNGEQTTAVNYTYDALNRLKTVIDKSGTTTYTYDKVGNQKTITYPNGVITEYIYNDVNQLENLITKNANGEVISSYTYQLENTGRRKKITEVSGRSTDYDYDNLYRLTDETIKDAINGSYRANYQYDWVGNRTYETVDGVSTAYSYDLNDRLTSQGGTTYTYDDNGNTLTETLDGNITTYTYDAKNKLINVEKAGTQTAYSYNVNGIRDSKTEAGVTTSYVVDSNRDYAQVLEEIVNDTTTVQYSYGHDLLNQNRNDEFKFYQYDGLGSTRSLTNSTGDITDTYDYEAFGEVINETGTTENNYKFTGEQFDSSLDQYYLRARYYDQGVGRFTQQDTYMGNNFDPVSLHKYLYGNADPVSYTDPTGNLSLAGIGTASSIRGSLSSMSVPAMSGAITQAVGGALRLGGQATGKIALRALRKCIRKQNKCGLRFNLLIVGYDNPNIREHIRDAQGPQTIVLTYQRNKSGNRQWYRNRGECRSGLRKGDEQCDEYPFFKTKEGGPRNYPITVSIRWVPAKENMSVGGHFGFLAKHMNGSRSDKDFVVITSDSLPIAALPMGEKKGK